MTKESEKAIEIAESIGIGAGKYCGKKRRESMVRALEAAVNAEPYSDEQKEAIKDFCTFI